MRLSRGCSFARLAIDFVFNEKQAAKRAVLCSAVFMLINVGTKEIREKSKKKTKKKRKNRCDYTHSVFTSLCFLCIGKND